MWDLGLGLDIFSLPQAQKSAEFLTSCEKKNYLGSHEMKITSPNPQSQVNMIEILP